MGPQPHRVAFTACLPTTPPIPLHWASRKAQGHRPEMRASPTGHLPADPSSRRPSPQRPLSQPHPYLLWRDLMIQVQEIKQITGTPPGITIPMRVNPAEDLEARTHIPPIMMRLERAAPHTPPIQGHVATNHHQDVLRPTPRPNTSRPRTRNHLPPTIQTQRLTTCWSHRSRACPPTDNGYAERFVGLFKLAVAERQPYRTLGDFLRAAQTWVNFYNTTRPHESLDYRSPDQYAQEQQLGSVPSISLF